MNPHFLIIPLSLNIRLRLTSLCYGLSQVRWVDEENFCITLRAFGLLSDLIVSQICEHLRNVFFSPFSLDLQGIDYFKTEGNRGVIGARIIENPPLTELRKEIDRQLRILRLKPDAHFHPSHVILGYGEKINPQRLGDYLSNHAHFQSSPIEVKNLLMIRSFQTSKRINHDVIEEFSASKTSGGED